MVAAEPSYDHFFFRVDPTVKIETKPSGGLANAERLIRTAEQLAQAPLAIVAIDMPLSRLPIVSRRTADNEVSRYYGARKCSTHTPSDKRPGAISDNLRTAFETAGFPLQTAHVANHGVIEVYPHPALVELMGADERLPYKLAKTRTYWKQSDPAARKSMLLNQWAAIADILDSKIQGAADLMVSVHPSSPGFELKAAEDVLDAMVCAWVAIEALAGRCKPFGDQDAAIWIPNGNISAGD